MTELGDHPLQAALVALLGSRLVQGDLVGELDRQRLRGMAHLLQYRIATASPPTAALCRAALERLTEDDAQRLLRSPTLCAALRLDQPEETLVDLLEAATDEHARDAPRTLDCGLAIDLASPLRAMPPSAGLLRPRRLTEAEAVAATARCNRAIALLETSAPWGSAILAGLADHVALCIDDARRGECWGATSGLAIGRIVVVNPNDAASDHHLAEALLHETVHVALDCAELARPLLTSEASEDRKLASPWTGTPLTCHAYLHAVVVWAVLLDFWTRSLARAPGHASMIERHQWITAGFDRFDPKSLADFQPGLAPYAFAVASAAVTACKAPAAHAA